MRCSTFVRPLSFDLSSMGDPTRSICSRWHSSPDHCSTQAIALRQGVGHAMDKWPLLMEKWADVTFDLLIFTGKKFKNHHSGILFSGVNKKLFLQSLVAPTRSTKSFQKLWFRSNITLICADSYHTLPWSQTFFLIFLPPAKQRIQVSTRVHRLHYARLHNLTKLSQGGIWQKN